MNLAPHKRHLISLKGFTLVEVLVVILIIAMAAAAFTGLARGTLESYQLKKAVQELVLAAKYAKVMAIEYQSPCTLHLDSDKKEFYLSTVTFDQNNSQVQQQIVKNGFMKPVKLPDNVTFIITSIIQTYMPQTEIGKTVNNQVVFLPNGTSDAAAIVLGNNTQQYTVTISPNSSEPLMQEGIQELESLSIDLDLTI